MLRGIKNYFDPRENQAQRCRQELDSLYHNGAPETDALFTRREARQHVANFLERQGVRYSDGETSRDCLAQVFWPAPASGNHVAFLRQACGLERPKEARVQRRDLAGYAQVNLFTFGDSAKSAAKHRISACVALCRDALAREMHKLVADEIRTEAVFAYGQGTPDYDRVLSEVPKYKDADAPEVGPVAVPQPTIPAGNAMRQLSEMIGLHAVKKCMKVLRARLEVSQVEAAGKSKPKPRPPHLFFAGNPGTGKTTVARLYGSMLRDLGMLESGHIVEVRRGDLVGAYIGQTAIKTREAIDRAAGGVLFVDDAHTLAPGDRAGQDFGKEAVSEIMKAMTDRSDIAVVFATYSSKMAQVKALDPGLARRFKSTITFDDYSNQDLARILDNACRESELEITPQLAARVSEQIGARRGAADFGNAGMLARR